jgi:hypothetical protein
MIDVVGRESVKELTEEERMIAIMGPMYKKKLEARKAAEAAQGDQG